MNENNNKSFEQILKESAKKQISIYSFSKTYPAYIILVIFLMISYFVFRSTKSNVENSRRTEFEKAIQSVDTRLNNLLQTETEILNSMRGLYDIVPQVVRDYFEIYGTVPTKTYNSIVSISYILPVNNAQKGQFIYNSQSIGYYDYQINPAGDRPFYYAVQMMVPFSNYQDKLLGFDIATIPELKTAFEKALDNNELVASDFIKFPIHKNTLTTFLFSPIYPKNAKLETLEERKQSFQGALGMEIDVKAFFEESLAGGSSLNRTVFPTDSSIIFQFFEKRNGQSNLIFSSSNAHSLSTFTPSLSSSVIFKIADKEIELKFYTVKNFGGALQQYMPYLALGISLILSLVLFGFILSVITSRGRALDLAERMTRSQRRIIENTQDIIAAMDLTGIWRSMNPASEKIFGLLPNELIGNSIFDLFTNEKEKNNFQEILNENTDETLQRIDVRMKKKDKSEIWVNWSLTISKDDGLAYVIGRDVTLEKKAEEEAELRSRQIHLASYVAQEANEAKTMFMINASHQLRNSLTGVLGYLQLLNEKFYDNEEELSNYIKLAEESSEEIFSFVSDFVDVALQGTNSEVNLDNVKFSKVIHEIQKQLEENNIKISSPDNLEHITLQISEKHLIRSLYEIISALTEGLTNQQVDFSIEINDFDGTVSLQILAPPNPFVSDLISLYKESMDDIIDILKDDKEEVIFRFAKAASKIRIMNGQVSFDTFGRDDQNLSTINLPLKRKII